MYLYCIVVQVWRLEVVGGGAVLERAGAVHCHEGGAGALAWSGDGDYLATAGGDSLVRVWGVEHLQLLGTGHQYLQLKLGLPKIFCFVQYF